MVTLTHLTSSTSRWRPLAGRAGAGDAGDQSRAHARRGAGTAKSLLSELIAAAVSGTSTLTVQGGAATEDQIKYGWNYALLVAEGPSRRSLVPAPMLRGMAEGRIVRFEEITRCPPSPPPPRLRSHPDPAPAPGPHPPAQSPPATPENHPLVTDVVTRVDGGARGGHLR